MASVTKQAADQLGGGVGVGEEGRKDGEQALFSTHFTTTLLFFFNISVTPDRCFAFSVSPSEAVSPSLQDAGATLTGTHWCDDEINLPLSFPTDVYW